MHYDAFNAESVLRGAGATFDSTDLKVITAAFDDAWSEIAPHYMRKGLKPQSARTKLANAILEAAITNRRDAPSFEGRRAAGNVSVASSCLADTDF